jgi:hypothetical protein
MFCGKEARVCSLCISLNALRCFKCVCVGGGLMECLNTLMASLVKCRWEVWLLAGASVLLKSVLCLASVDWLLTVGHLFSSLIPTVFQHSSRDDRSVLML